MYGLGGILTSSVGLYQASDQHKRSQELESAQHEEELRKMREQHKRELLTARQTYLLATYTDVEQYFQELNENLINTSRDAERDMVDQRNQQYQTILVAATMMLTALLSILYQGNLPEKIPNYILISYSLTNTASLMTLLANIALCIEIMSRVSKFMYRRSQSNIEHLTEAMEQTKRMMKHIRGNAISLTTPVKPTKTTNESGAPVLPRTNSFTQYNTRRAISKLPEEEIESEWLNHEEEVYKYLERRNRINERMELLAIDLNNEFRVSFQKYWNDNCRILGNMSLLFFYIGTSLMLVSTMIFMWSYFTENYNSPVAAIISTVTILISLLICLAVAIYLRYFDQSIERLRVQMDQETEQLGREYSSTMSRLFRRHQSNHHD